MQCGSVCNTSEPPVIPICQLEARPICHWDGSTLATMDEMDRVCLSTIYLDQQGAQEKKSTILLIAPVWESQPWYPVPLALLVNFPTLLPMQQYLLTDPFGQPHPLTTSGQLHLTAWTLSRENIPQQEFQQKLHNCCSLDVVEAPIQPSSLPGRSGLAGASQGKLIPFCALCTYP